MSELSCQCAAGSTADAKLSRLESKLENVEALLTALADEFGARRPAVGWLPMRAAAAGLGLSVTALDFRLRRNNEKPGALPVRRARGLVHRADFQRWAEGLAGDTVGRQAQRAAAAAVERMTTNQRGAIR